MHDEYWVQSFFDDSVALHEARLDIDGGAVVTSLDGTGCSFALGLDSLAGWCFAMRATRMAWRNVVGSRMPVRELVDPHGEVRLAGSPLVLVREGLRWRTRWDTRETESQRSALAALLLSPRMLSDRIDVLEDSPRLWPAPATLERHVDSVSATRVMDVLEVGRGHSVVLDLDLDQLTLTPMGGQAVAFSSLQALFREAIGIRQVVKCDPCVVAPPPSDRDELPDGWEPWIVVPELKVDARHPEFNGRYWACNWIDAEGEEQCSSGVTPLEMIAAMLSRGQQVLNRINE